MRCRTALEAAEALDEWRILYLTNETLTRRLLSTLESYHDTGRMYFRPTRYATDFQLRIWFCLFVCGCGRRRDLMTARDIAALCMVYSGTLPVERPYPSWLTNSMQSLIDSGLLDVTTQTVSERGCVFVEAVRRMPLPIQSWSMPKQEGT